MKGLPFLLAILMAAPAIGGEVLRQGKHWPIIERDMREIIAEEVSEVSKARIRQELTKSVDTYLDNQPDYRLPTARTSTVRWLDLTWTLPEDMAMPVKQANGEWQIQVVYPKGTKVNPIEVQRPTDALVFFNAKDKAQVEAVKSLVAKHPEKWALLSTGGNPGKVAATLDRPVFVASQSTLERFGIKVVPSVVFAGNGAHAKHYGVSTIATPFAPEDLERVKALAFPELKPSKSR